MAAGPSATAAVAETRSAGADIARVAAVTERVTPLPAG